MTQRIFVFKTRKSSEDNRTALVAIPENQIMQLDTVWGAHNLYLKINGTQVEGSFDSLIEQLGTRIDMSGPRS